MAEKAVMGIDHVYVCVCMSFGRGKYWSMFFNPVFYNRDYLSTETLQSKNPFTSNSLSWNVLSCSYHVFLHSLSSLSPTFVQKPSDSGSLLFHKGPSNTFSLQYII